MGRGLRRSKGGKDRKRGRGLYQRSCITVDSGTAQDFWSIMAEWGGNNNGFMNMVPTNQDPPSPQRGAKPNSASNKPKSGGSDGFVNLIPTKPQQASQKQQQPPQQTRYPQQQRSGGGKKSVLPVNPQSKKIEQTPAVKYVEVTPASIEGPKVTFNSVFADSAGKDKIKNPPTAESKPKDAPKVLRLLDNQAYDDNVEARGFKPSQSQPTKVVQVGAWGNDGQPARQKKKAKMQPRGDRKSEGGVMMTVKKKASNFFGLSDDVYGGMYGDQKQSNKNQQKQAKMFDNPTAAALENASKPPKQSILKQPKEKSYDACTKYTKVDEGMAAYAQFIKDEKFFNKQKFGMTNFKGTLKHNLKATTGLNTGTQTLAKLSEKTMIQHELLSLPEFKPIFIKGISFVQFLVMAGMIAYSMTTQEFAKFGFSATDRQCDADCPVKFDGTPDTSAYQITQVNPWLGPNTDFLIAFNAKYSPCMREDTAIGLTNTRQRNEECGNLEAENQFNAVCDGFSGLKYPGMSCCVLGIGSNVSSSVVTSQADYNSFKTAGTAYGMMTHADCVAIPGALWLFPNEAQTLCEGGSTGITTTINIALRPCCIGIKSKCQLLTKSQCVYKSGIYHEDKQLCGDVACLEGVCKTKSGGEAKAAAHPFDNNIENGNQWYRFIAPIFIHAGGIQFIIVIIAQVYLGSPIERTIGFLRMFLIYFISGIGGFLVSGLFDPYVVSVGANGAVFGLLGVMLVELVQSWSVVPNRKRQLAKLLTIIFFAVILGSLPFIDNYAQLGGFIFGVISACIFLPYIHLGKWHNRGRKIILAIAAPLLLILIVLLIVLFYSVQNTDFCPGCKDVNCWQWHSSLSCDGARDD